MEIEFLELDNSQKRSLDFKKKSILPRNNYKKQTFSQHGAWCFYFFEFPAKSFSKNQKNTKWNRSRSASWVTSPSISSPTFSVRVKSPAHHNVVQIRVFVDFEEVLHPLISAACCTEPLSFLFLYQLNSCPEGVHQGLHRAPPPQTCRVDQWRSSSFSCTTVDHHWWHRRCAVIAPKRHSHSLGLITCFCPVCYVVT